MMGEIVDLPRVRAALAVLDELAAAGVSGRLLTDADLVELWGDLPREERMGSKATSLRLTAAQEVEIERLAEAINRTRPDLAALARGGEASPYTVIRLALDRGLRSLALELDNRGGGAP
jgi:hypothetical protein